MSPVFKTVAGYEGLYQVSDYGVIFSIKRNTTLKPDSAKGYKRVILSKDGITTRFSVHRLVAVAFIPNPDNKPFVNHINNDRAYNSRDNLEWCTHTENMEHSSKQGRQDKVRRAGGFGKGKLSEQRLIKLWKAKLQNRFISSNLKMQNGRMKRFVTYIDSKGIQRVCRSDSTRLNKELTCH